MLRSLLVLLTLLALAPASAEASRARLPGAKVLGGGYKTVRTADVAPRTVVATTPNVAPDAVASAATREFRRRTRTGRTETVRVTVQAFDDDTLARRWFFAFTGESGWGIVSTGYAVGEEARVRNRSTRTKRAVRIVYYMGAEAWEVSLERSAGRPGPSFQTAVELARRVAQKDL